MAEDGFRREVGFGGHRKEGRVDVKRPSVDGWTSKNEQGHVHRSIGSVRWSSGPGREEAGGKFSSQEASLPLPGRSDLKAKAILAYF